MLGPELVWYKAVFFNLSHIYLKLIMFDVRFEDKIVAFINPCLNPFSGLARITSRPRGARWWPSRAQNFGGFLFVLTGRQPICHSAIQGPPNELLWGECHWLPSVAGGRCPSKPKMTFVFVVLSGDSPIAGTVVRTGYSWDRRFWLMSLLLIFEALFFLFAGNFNLQGSQE